MITCLWCAGEVPKSPRQRGPKREFCSPACKSAFNNLRAMRGAELYDLFRALRRERGRSKDLNLWTAICRLEEKWAEQDARERPGRRSYVEPSKAVMRLTDAGKISRNMTHREIEEDAERRRKAYHPVDSLSQIA